MGRTPEERAVILRVGFVLDEFGRPTRAITRDEGPSHAEHPVRGFRGSHVVGASGDGRNRSVAAQSARKREERAS